MSILLDTHVWVWFVEGSKRLPAASRRLIERNIASSHLSAISRWEVAMLARRGRLRLDRDAESWCLRAQQLVPVIEEPITGSIALAASRLDQVKDPADAFIAATGRELDIPLVTFDDRLRGLPGVKTRTR